MTTLTNPQRLIHARERLAVARRILFLVEKDDRVPLSEVRAAAKRVLQCLAKVRDAQPEPRKPPTTAEWREAFQAVKKSRSPFVSVQAAFFTESGTIDPAAFAKLPKGRINAR
jgi:hypothetical protein